MTNQEGFSVPASQIAYGEIVYWVTVVSCIICTVGPLIAMMNVDNNVLNPHYLFAAIFEGKTASEIWSIGGGKFPGGHFYFNNFTKGDGFTQFGLALGCSVGFYGLIAAVFLYLKEKKTVFAVLGLWVAFLIFVAATGIVTKGH